MQLIIASIMVGFSVRLETEEALISVCWRAPSDKD